MESRILQTGLTFDDVLLVPAYSEVLPAEVDTASRLTRNIPLNVPVLSSPMDTVTESEMAIGMAQEGGIGIIHKNLSVDQQAMEVDRVKRSEHGVIVDPVTLPPDATVGEAAEIMDRRNIGGVPITENGKLKGIITRRDMRFLDSNETRIAEVMTKENLVTAGEHTDLKDAERILRENKVEKLLLVDDQYQLRGLITIKDIDKTQRFPRASKDERGRLRVGAAAGNEMREMRAAGRLPSHVETKVERPAKTVGLVDEGGVRRERMENHHTAAFHRQRNCARLVDETVGYRRLLFGAMGQDRSVGLARHHLQAAVFNCRIGDRAPDRDHGCFICLVMGDPTVLMPVGCRDMRTDFIVAKITGRRLDAHMLDRV